MTKPKPVTFQPRPAKGVHLSSTGSAVLKRNSKGQTYAISNRALIVGTNLKVESGKQK
jgi:hypothetical protein